MDNRFGFSRTPAPSKCPDCGTKFKTLEYGVKYEHGVRITSFDGFYRTCSCGCVITWSFPNVWKRRHILPLLDDRAVIATA